MKKGNYTYGGSKGLMSIQETLLQAWMMNTELYMNPLHYLIWGWGGGEVSEHIWFNLWKLNAHMMQLHCTENAKYVSKQVHVCVLEMNV
jgi:hypothetical protein